MRLTRRKRKILEILARSKPRGVSLLNEMRVKYTEGDESREDISRRSDQRKSFNRTVLENFDIINAHHLAEKDYGFDRQLTIGLFARWAVWELIDQGYLSGCPEPKEMALAVGNDACSAFAVLKNDQLAVVGTAVFMSSITIVADRELHKDDLEQLSDVPWKVYGFKRSGIDDDPHCLVAELGRLPNFIEFSDTLTVSAAKKKFMFR
ncbi:hypothetical protein [Rhizobium mulingense]|uniref:hypothetical protein n=1 Tax=Rhizobium mulingense TaxID=3031128 RepID=UPI002B46BF7C|nr:hypothetical protein [Rhizobium sp. MJ21]MEB3047696.1 hypothetical protein [Rhizobium sp. MJ21]